jgi:uncharacterized membrane protein
MAYRQPQADVMPPEGPGTGESTGAAKAVYILYLVSILLGITAIIGLIMAYVNRGDAPVWLETHYRYQIRTFWIGLLYWLISGVLLAVFYIGVILMIAALIWWIARCAVGLKYLGRGEPLPNPASWLLT